MAGASSRCPAVKRLLREAAELAAPTEELCARPLQDNLFEWHFTVRGPPATDFESGVYHGRVLLPVDYPMRPPNIVLMTPNGRFEVNRKICLSISGHHPETWQPSWSIRTALLALVAFMPTPGEGTVGSLDYPPAERRALARRSAAWKCPSCGPPAELLAPAPTPDGTPDATPDRAPAPPPTSPLPPLPSVASHPSAACPSPKDSPPSSPSPPPTVSPVVPRRGSSDSFRDCVVACLVISVAIFIYRRFGAISYLGSLLLEN